MFQDTLNKKRKFSIKDFISTYDQICSFLRICSHLLNKLLIENFRFCVVIEQDTGSTSMNIILVYLPLTKVEPGSAVSELSKKCLHSEFFWSVFIPNAGKYRSENSEYGHLTWLAWLGSTSDRSPKMLCNKNILKRFCKSHQKNHPWSSFFFKSWNFNENKTPLLVCKCFKYLFKADSFSIKHLLATASDT